MANLQEIVAKLEGYGFECEAGPLEKCEDWKALKSFAATEVERYGSAWKAAMEERQWFEDRCKEHRATILALAELCRPAVAHYMRTQERAAMSNALSQGAKEAAKAEAEKLGKLLDEIDSIPSPLAPK